MVLFSIIVTDYDGTVSNETRQNFFDCMKGQTIDHKEFEILLMHDGIRKELLQLNLGDLNVKSYEADKRANLWGHNLRNEGLKLTHGDFIVHTNIDNLYYPDALSNFKQAINDNKDTQIFIGNVKMMGLNVKGGKVFYDTPRDYTKSAILTGNPPVYGNVDLMSLVASKKVWEDIDGWYCTVEQADAVIYEVICALFGYKNVPFIIGEHY